MIIIKFVCLVLFMFGTEKSDNSDSKTKEYLDLKNDQDNVILWENVFTKMNTILRETSKLTESVNDLRESLAKLIQRHDEQEHKFTNFMEDTQKHFTDLKRELFQQNCNHNHEWTTILRRQDGSLNFYRNWTEYQEGFGNSDGEFFIGLNKLHNMTALGAKQELMVVLKDFENQTRSAKYDLFQIGNETEKYALKQLGLYSGDAGDSLDYHRGMKFSTYDQDNDLYDPANCAEYRKGAWWFRNCYWSHLFGPYRFEKEPNVKGVGWNTWKGEHYSLKYAEMKIRSKIV